MKITCECGFVFQAVDGTSEDLQVLNHENNFGITQSSNFANTFKRC